MNTPIITKAALLITLAGSAQTHAQFFPATIDLSSLDGTTGFVLNGIDVGDQSGRSVSSAGDVNADGIDDIIIGASLADPNGGSSGESYVVYGGPTVGNLGVIELSTLDGTNGFIVHGVDADDRSGFSVSSAGDVNGDGIDDLIIGAQYADPNGTSSSESYVIFGGPGVGSLGVIELSTLNGTDGYVLNGIAFGDVSGRSVSGAGDINGDGINDLLIGAPYADPNGNSFAGETYVIFGGASVGSTGVFELSTLNGTNGFVLRGIDADDQSGRSVSSAGDVNADGIDDIIIGASLADPNGPSTGESYVIFGGATVGSTGVIELSSLNGTNGFALNGIDAYDISGRSVSGAGDINGDSIDDLLIGAPYGDPNGGTAGESYVVFGGASIGSTGTIELSALNGINGFVLNGVDPDDRSGRSVSSAGDINGDGIDDLIIGAHYANPSGPVTGACYVVFGEVGIGSTGVFELSSLNGANGLALSGIDSSDDAGRSVSSAGDINADGINDLIIGAPLASPNGAASGESYVIFGRKGHTWISPVDGEFDNPTNWFVGVTPDSGPVFIEPQFGVTVTGPAGALSIASLTLGADFGRTEFAMQEGSLVENEDAFAIPSTAVLSGSGTLVVDAGVMNDGLIDSTDLTVISATGVTNNGEVRLENFPGSRSVRSMEVFGSLANGASGEMFFRGNAVFETNGGVTNDGAVDFADVDATVRGGVVNNAAMSGSAGSVIVFTDDLANNGTFELAVDSSVSILGDLSGNGVTGPGGGMGGSVFIGGDFIPAFSLATGMSSFGGDLSLGANSNTAIELGGVGDVDQVVSLGTVALGGDLSVTVLGAYVPGVGDTFTLINAATRVGTFASESLPALDPGLSWDLSYTPTGVVLSVLGAVCAADFNTDGTVDSADLAILLAAWNSPGADLNGDSITDSGDLAILLAAWGVCD